MFRVEADTLQTYLDFDPIRKIDLQRLDKLLGETAPGLKRYFHKGTPAGEPGMRFKMIGYGKSHYPATSGQQVEWPVVGVALQKSYISVYLSGTKDDAPLVRSYAGRLGECRMGRNNFSFVRFDDLNLATVSALFAEADQIFNADSRRQIPPEGRHRPGSALHSPTRRHQ